MPQLSLTCRRYFTRFLHAWRICISLKFHTSMARPCGEITSSNRSFAGMLEKNTYNGVEALMTEIVSQLGAEADKMAPPAMVRRRRRAHTPGDRVRGHGSGCTHKLVSSKGNSFYKWYTYKCSFWVSDILHQAFKSGFHHLKFCFLILSYSSATPCGSLTTLWESGEWGRTFCFTVSIYVD